MIIPQGTRAPRQKETVPMKTTKNNQNKLTRKTLKRLEKIAMDISPSLKDRGGLDPRNNDAEDFPDVSIVSIERMLEAAYCLGLEDATANA